MEYRSRNRPVRRAAGGMGLLAVLACLAPPARAEVLKYALEIPDRRRTTLAMEFRVDHPGVVVVRAEWDVVRALSLRLDGPGPEPLTMRRVGASPLELRVTATERALASGRPWTLQVRALPTAGHARGTVTLTLPEPVAARAPARPAPRAPDRHERRPWLSPAAPPRHAPPGVVALFDAFEDLRDWVVDTNTGAVRPDACGWHDDLLDYLTPLREATAAGDRPLAPETRRFLLRLVDAIEAVDGFRSRDPVLAGPPPEDPARREAWLVIRGRRTALVESELDDLLHAVRRDYVPQLESQEWPQRFIGCLTACERHFEQAGRVGDEAVNAALARNEWDGFLRAAAVLRAAASIGTPIDTAPIDPSPPDDDGTRRAATR